MQPIAISVDEPSTSRDLSRKAGYTYPLLSDPDLKTIAAYDLVHKGQGVDGHDIARPAEFLVDKDGVVRWRNLTNDFRVRARPDDLLRATALLSR